MNRTVRAVMLTTTLLLAGCFSGPRILSSFGDGKGPEGFFRRDGPHKGIDVAGMVGSPVLAVAEGNIVMAEEGSDSCGTIVVIRHSSFGYDSIYCHLQDFTKSFGAVERGELIGHVGTSGQRPGDGFEHVHLGIRDNNREMVDPEKLMSGCFEPGRTYPSEGRVFTYPVPCRN
jgi:murein DD-endopeptidase MepM/ murein hydrolase activator NlpD